MAGGIRFFSAGPLPVLAIILLIGFILLLIPLLVLGIIGAAFTKMGLSWIAALALVFLMLAGSFVNIPLYRIHRDMVRAVPVDSDGNVPADPFAAPGAWEMIISINLGGGIVPLCIIAYMVYQAVMVTGKTVMVPVTICAALVMIVAFVSTRDISGAGIRVPFLIPALTALVCGLLLGGGTGLTAAVTALAGGTLGTLTGGNLAHLPRLRNLGATEASIGGSGTFGAILLCCVLPALIA